MKLTIVERLLLLNLDLQGSFLALKETRKFLEAVSFSDEERTQLQFDDSEPGRMQWDVGAAERLEREFEVPDAVRRLIANALHQLDRQALLTEKHVPLYEKFVEGR